MEKPVWGQSKDKDIEDGNKESGQNQIDVTAQVEEGKFHP